MGVAETSLSISQVTDVKTGSENNLLTPGKNLKINGYKIKVAGDNENTGVYFVSQDSGEATKVDPTDIVVNNPSELLIIIPDLAVGTYKLQLTTQYSGATFLKDPRTALLDKTLAVQ